MIDLCNTIFDSFESSIVQSNTIFDIMAAAYKTILPFEPAISLEQDSDLGGMIECFSEQHDMNQALADIKAELIEWLHNHQDIDMDKMKNKLFCLIRMIDQKCVKVAETSLPDPYIRYFALNDLFQDEIIIVPHFKSFAMDLLSAAISQQEGHGFYGGNHVLTADISGYLHNFIICRIFQIKPRINIVTYHNEIRGEFEQKHHKLKVGVFPLSNVNLRSIFQIEENIAGENGLFCIKSAVDEQENQVLERCKEALRICRDQGVDIAVFPEMLFTEKIWDDIIGFVRSSNEGEKSFPLFMWMGTAWANKENKCRVIDRYGNMVFEQKKYVPYEYRKTHVREDGEKGTVKIRENLAHDEKWIVNFLDIPDLFRIATAICRDISSGLLKESIKVLCSNMMIIPAFSKSNRLTHGNIDSLAYEQIITIVCNACSALCEETQEKFEVTQQMTERTQPFCYLCMPAKRPEDNVADYHNANYSACMECKNHCKGYVWEISFKECTVEKGCYSAKVTHLNS